MPGKHAPESSTSFILSLARAAGGALAVLGVVVLIAVVAVNSRGDEEPRAGGSPRSTASPTDEPTQTGTPRTTPPTPSPSPTPRPPEQVAVQVLNGNGRTGVAGETSSELAAEGYEVLEPGNHAITAKTTIYFRRGFRADARALREALFPYADADQVIRSDDEPGSADANIVVVLGQDQPA